MAFISQVTWLSPKHLPTVVTKTVQGLTLLNTGMERKVCDKAKLRRLKLSHHQSTQWQLYLLFFIILKLKNLLQGIKTLIYELLLDQ